MATYLHIAYPANNMQYVSSKCLHIYVLHLTANYILHVYSIKRKETESLRPLLLVSKKVLIAAAAFTYC